MRSPFTSGSVRGAAGNGDPYRDPRANPPGRVLLTRRLSGRLKFALRLGSGIERQAAIGRDTLHTGGGGLGFAVLANSRRGATGCFAWP